MKKLIALAFIACVTFIASGSGVYAQWMVPVVSSCAGQTYTAGQNRVLTQDTTGDLCTNATGGGGGGGNTTITAPLGGLGIPDGSGVSVSLTGTVPTGFTTPCAGALGDVGFQACLIQIAQNAPNVNVSSTPTPLTGETVSSHTYMDTNVGLVGGSALALTSGSLPVAPYPATAVPVTASTTGTTGATTATLTNVTGHTTYICGFSIRANATAAATNNATVTGTVTGTLNFTQWTAPLASGLGVTEEAFVPCIPASAISTSIAVISGAPGSGGTVSVTAWGYSI
jgi:hypothetical protein